jgi:DNA polymerase
MEQHSATEFIPATFTLESLRSAATLCRGCDLYRHASQTVFGEGLPGATVVLIGEQPGDREDRTGRPFVGPAGTLLDRALEEAGIERAAAYVTNAVKHFKWELRGTRRLHKKPSEREIDACTP